MPFVIIFTILTLGDVSLNCLDLELFQMIDSEAFNKGSRTVFLYGEEKSTLIRCKNIFLTLITDTLLHEFD